MTLRKVISMLLVITMLFAICTSSVLASYVNIRNYSNTVDDYECIRSSKYNETRVLANSIMTALDMTASVRMRALVAVDIVYTTGTIDASQIIANAKTVNQQGDTVNAYVSQDYDTTRLISYFRCYHWYEVDGTTIDGGSYESYYNGITG